MPARSEKVLKMSPEVTVDAPLLEVLFEHICQNERSGKRVVFCKPAQSVFLHRSLKPLGCFDGALWRGFCTNIDCSLESTTSQKPLFHIGMSTVLTVAAGPGSIQGEKTRKAETMPVFQSRKKGPPMILNDLGVHKEPECGFPLIKCCFFSEFFFMILFTVFG